MELAPVASYLSKNSRPLASALRLECPAKLAWQAQPRQSSARFQPELNYMIEGRVHRLFVEGR